MCDKLPELLSAVVLLVHTLFLSKQPEPSGWLLLVGAITCSCLISPCAVAQIIPDKIIPDNTLGQENSVVVPNVEIKGVNSDRIDGGALRDSNLFHSFREFNIGEGRGA